MKKLKTFRFILFILFSAFKLHAGTNVPLCIGQDATICAGQTVTITNCNSGSNASNASGIYLNSPTNVTLTDDVWSGIVNIGFTFNFYGNNYTQCVIGSNGLISFGIKTILIKQNELPNCICSTKSSCSTESHETLIIYLEVINTK